MLSPVGRDIADLRASVSPRKTSPDLETIARLGVDEHLEAVGRKLFFAQEFVAELGAVGESDPREPRRSTDLHEVVQSEVRAFESRVARAGIELRLASVPPSGPAPARVGSRAASLLVHQLLSHAVAASRRGSAVVVEVHAPDGDLGARIVVDDAGTPLPASARRALLALEIEPGTFGRPAGIALFLAAEISAWQGALLDVGDAPETGGVRVTVTFGR